MTELTDTHTIMCGNCGKRISARIPDMICPATDKPTGGVVEDTKPWRETTAYNDYITPTPDPETAERNRAIMRSLSTATHHYTSD